MLSGDTKQLSAYASKMRRDVRPLEPHRLWKNLEPISPAVLREQVSCSVQKTRKNLGDRCLRASACSRIAEEPLIIYKISHSYGTIAISAAARA